MHITFGVLALARAHTAFSTQGPALHLFRVCLFSICAFVFSLLATTYTGQSTEIRPEKEDTKKKKQNIDFGGRCWNPICTRQWYLGKTKRNECESKQKQNKNYARRKLCTIIHRKYVLLKQKKCLVLCVSARASPFGNKTNTYEPFAHLLALLADVSEHYS